MPPPTIAKIKTSVKHVNDASSGIFLFAYRYKTTKTNFQPMPTYKRSTRNRNRTRTRTRTRTHNRGGGQTTFVERIQKRWFGENEKLQAKLNKLEASLHETRDKMACVAKENKNLIDQAAKQATRTKKQTERDRKNARYMGMGGVTIGALAGAGIGVGGMRRHLEQAKLAKKIPAEKTLRLLPAVMAPAAMAHAVGKPSRSRLDQTASRLVKLSTKNYTASKRATLEKWKRKVEELKKNANRGQL